MLVKRWARITKVKHEALDLVDVDDKKTFSVNGQDLIDSLANGCQYTLKKTVTLTEVAEILTTAHQKPFCVCFVKANGKDRNLTGRFVSTEPLLGRSYVEDLELQQDRLRLVDHRTIKWLIVDDTLYEVKK